MSYVYMLKCLDDSLYTGICNDLEKRISLHREGKGAKYTKSHGVKELCAVWMCEDYNDARKLEYAIKHRLSRKQKLMLIQENLLLENFINMELSVKFTRLNSIPDIV